MKAKLIKENDFYYLIQDDKIIAEIDGHPLKSITGKLSKQNCDEIFGVVDVEKLAQDYAKSQCEDLHDELGKTGAEWGWETALDFKNGFKKAMELNKDKVFTLEDFKLFARMYYREIRMNKSNLLWDSLADKCLEEHLTLIQHPTEIKVEIEMEKVVDETKVIGAVKGVKGSGDKITTYKSVPKLDADGCLILRKL